MKDNEREILERMRDGYELVTGRGLWSLHCRLTKGGESHLVHRSVFARLRNEGWVRYEKKHKDSETRLLAVLTDVGLKALEETDEVSSV